MHYILSKYRVTRCDFGAKLSINFIVPYLYILRHQRSINACMYNVKVTLRHSIQTQLLK